MATWKKVMHQLGYRAESRFDQLRWKLKRRLGYDHDLQIVPYRGFGTAASLTLKGRVLEAHGFDAIDGDRLWDNLLSSYRRYASREVPDMRVRAVFQGVAQETLSDEEGYFDIELHPAELDPKRLWHSVELTLPERPDEPAADGQVLVPPGNSRFGVISDIDDTILITHATSLLKMARLTFLHNARTRLAFSGVAPFYRALQQDSAGQYRNPIFYVSSSPWNLYDFLIDFMELNEIPLGPLLLRDLGLDKDKFIKSSHANHKRAQIDKVMNTYPELPFILIGDSGQRDPEIYREVALASPERILAIYIRDLSLSGRDQEVKAMAAELAKRNIQLLAVETTIPAAEHAAERGYIDAGRLPAIHAATAEDERPADEIERLVDPDA